MSKFLFEPESRLTTYPILHKDIWKFYKLHESLMWFTEKIDLTPDHTIWPKLDTKVKKFIKNIIAFFAASDTIVNMNILERFLHVKKGIQLQEVRYYYIFQAMMENIHSEMYSILLDTFSENSEDREYYLNAVNNVPSIKAKKNWAQRWTREENDFLTLLVAFACVEGIFFSSSFCAIFWLGRDGKTSGLTTSNEYIARDEGLHTAFACFLYKKCIEAGDEHISTRIIQIVKEAVEVEKQFVKDILPSDLPSMNHKLMEQYVECVADGLLRDLGVNPIYEVEQPFTFMDTINMKKKKSFFEVEVTQYRKFDIGSERKEYTFTKIS